ncbi:DUF1810 domain-containing protein [Trinickia caryophylli]|uniref:Uncharacterized protein, DUF1810 family n=1 Tax=Trinickia caryophylli TaxID=28094 RepID=A0A1X7GJR3_TRICW|nr:DUF1810 domain-containing protein [Trinickia caryophylli]PMS09866.1 DUF1810 domain-containing protein [Trinickia caryophylli]TRX14901.1 DUF1810 domain-containing protein [Trinickia caryophylli]WQE14751.1 DUF1810 domain-containing protein [Trinickia caryophylli]SMF70155.1 Uncharacterized protein, DUF1810 family [Trinickia caryophylli]GLU34949.1 hypothetical protein Busp01_47910 [Trinickia caryophylli]
MNVEGSEASGLQRFANAQAPVYGQVRAELRAGHKRSHWMWFVFPQIAGLGHSAMAARFAIVSLDEARAYLAHPILGARLRECTELVNAIEDRPIDQIFGYPDDLKFRSSMTLFAEAAGSHERAPFVRAIEKYFNGEFDSLTLALARPTNRG